MAYEASLKAKWDTQNTFDYAIKEAAEKAAKEGRQKGLEEGLYEYLLSLFSVIAVETLRLLQIFLVE